MDRGTPAPRLGRRLRRRAGRRFQIPRHKKLRELSLGQQSALGMTFGLATRAPVTLFDESHLGMDAPSRAAFSDELLADFMAHPRTIVISTYLIDELSPLFEQVVIVDRGRLVLQDETEVLRARGADVTGPALDHHACCTRPSSPSCCSAPRSSPVLAALLAVGFALEGVLYRAMGWTQGVEPERLYDGPGQLPLVFVSYWAVVLVWTTIGLLLAAGFYRSGGSELVAVLLALAMVVVTGYGIGFSGLPFVGAVVDVADVPLAGTFALCLAGLLPGAAATWALVRDLPIRNP